MRWGCCFIPVEMKKYTEQRVLSVNVFVIVFSVEMLYNITI